MVGTDRIRWLDVSGSSGRMESDLVVGSGRNMHKTTIIHLLPRFYQLDSGRILIDGHDIADVTVKSLRRQIGIVLQQTFLFDRSIRENIAFGKPGATLPEAKEAARAAEMHEFIESLPEGYDTLVGQRGAILSGGQRQRIAIARMLPTDPRMVVLDESTAVPPRGLEEQETRAYTEHVLKQAGASRSSLATPPSPRSMPHAGGSRG